MNSSESARKNKWIAGGAVIVMLLAGGSIARLLYLQRQAAPGDLTAQIVATNARLALSPAEQARRLEVVTHLRETWQPWAKQHQSELRRMLAASPSDTAARDVVWSAIPTVPQTKEVLLALNTRGKQGKGEVFTWNAISRPIGVSQMSAMPADTKNRLNKSLSSLNWHLQNDFKEQRDIVISQSTQTGLVSVSFWASGRVTEDTIDDRHLRSTEGVGVFTYKRKELTPPYDFLSSK